MKTLNKKVLPTLRVLIHQCNASGVGSLHLLSKDGNQKLAMREITEKKNPKFDFYQITDGKFLVIDIAVLKENRDSIVPYKYYDDDNEKWETLVEFTDDGLMIVDKINEHHQGVFCYWMNIWFELINTFHKIA